jgi:transcriptional regulator with XRE-family HTH domain
MMTNEALRLIRVFHDLNQSELATRLSLPKSRISEIENHKRKPSLDVIELYAQEFNIPVSAILFFAESLPEAQSGEKVRTKIASKVLNLLQFIEKRAEEDNATT